MINPLCISTDGYLKSTKLPLSVSVNGYLCFELVTEIGKSPFIGGSTKYDVPRINDNMEVPKKQSILYDDNEILIILKAFVQCQENVLKN